MDVSGATSIPNHLMKSVKNGAEELCRSSLLPWLNNHQPNTVASPRCLRNQLSTSAVFPVHRPQSPGPHSWPDRPRSRKAICSSRPISVGFATGSFEVKGRWVWLVGLSSPSRFTIADAICASGMSRMSRYPSIENRPGIGVVQAQEPQRVAHLMLQQVAAKPAPLLRDVFPAPKQATSS